MVQDDGKQCDKTKTGEEVGKDSNDLDKTYRKF